jgi:DNA-binding transcriptional regulator/RsmH inhibitor MraZ
VDGAGQRVPKTSGRTVVVFGFGKILEVWDAAKWHDYVRAVAKTKLSAVSEAIEDLGNR